MSYNLGRRRWLQACGLGISSLSLSGWLPLLADDAAQLATPKRCILLWMPGGPSQIDTFDPKPEHRNGGEFEPIETSVSGIRIGEHLPTVAQQAEHLAIVRSMKTVEGDHLRAALHLRTGYRPVGPIKYPSLGAMIGNELGTDEAELPNFVSVLPNQFFSRPSQEAGFLGPSMAPLVVGGNLNYATPNGEDEEGFGPPLEVRNLARPDRIDTAQANARLELLLQAEDRFRESRPGLAVDSHRTAYESAVRMMRSSARTAFDLDEEPDELRARYGRTAFGQGCLLARRLIERGVPFVEVGLNGVEGTNAFGWDSHSNNFEAVRQLCGVLDPAWGTLLADLQDRGMLNQTLVVWMGEFGRTPTINGGGGRDHFPNAWSTVLSGAGIQGGQVYGTTSDDGMAVAENPVSVPQLMASICSALDIDHKRQNMSNVGRPIRLVEPEADPIEQLLANSA